jgi:hypothetical protein
LIRGSIFWDARIKSAHDETKTRCSPSPLAGEGWGEGPSRRQFLIGAGGFALSLPFASFAHADEAAAPEIKIESPENLFCVYADRASGRVLAAKSFIDVNPEIVNGPQALNPYIAPTRNISLGTRTPTLFKLDVKRYAIVDIEKRNQTLSAFDSLHDAYTPGEYTHHFLLNLADRELSREELGQWALGKATEAQKAAALELLQRVHTGYNGELVTGDPEKMAEAVRFYTGRELIRPMLFLGQAPGVGALVFIPADGLRVASAGQTQIALSESGAVGGGVSVGSRTSMASAVSTASQGATSKGVSAVAAAVGSTAGVGAGGGGSTSTGGSGGASSGASSSSSSGGSSGGCFIAGTVVTLADGTDRKIEDIKIGDHLLGLDGSINEVLGLVTPKLGERLLYGFNDGPAFVTAGHPFLTKDGQWKSIDPAATLLEKGGAGYHPHPNPSPASGRGANCENPPASERGAFDPLPLGEGGERSEPGEGFSNGSAIISSPHPEEGRRPVSKDDLRNLAPSFETAASRPPQDEAREKGLSFNPASVAKLDIGDSIFTKSGEVKIERIHSAPGDPAQTLYDFNLSGNHTYFADGYAVHNKGCFVYGTKVLMADGLQMSIEIIKIGDTLLGLDGSVNEVLGLVTPKLGERLLYGFNDDPAFVTASHPFRTKDGQWKSIDPAATLQEKVGMVVGKLDIGDSIITKSGEVKIERIHSASGDADQTLYDFILSGTHTYFADGYAVHNKCFVSGTEVLFADGSIKPIEEVKAGDRLQGQEGAANEVAELKRPQLGQRPLYSFNGGAYFVTDSHPFMTEDGWKSIDPAATALENLDLEVAPLKVGDVLVSKDGPVTLASIAALPFAPETPLFNFRLTGNQTYFVREKGSSGPFLLVHNK